MFEDPTKLEAKLIGMVSSLPEFRKFFANNSQLGRLFSLPGAGSGSSGISLAGLQTRASVNQALVDRFGSGASVTRMMQQNMQAAQGQLNALKNKLQSHSSGS